MQVLDVAAKPQNVAAGSFPAHRREVIARGAAGSRESRGMQDVPAAKRAWSRRVRRVGGMIQAAFAVFWLLRGAHAIGGRGADLLIVLSLLAGMGTFAYALKVTSGKAARPGGGQAKKLEKAVTIATIVEFLAALVLPLVAVAAGHYDWVLPSIAITVGPLLLYLHLLLDVPRYRAAGWALTVGPLVLVAGLSGTALVASTGIAAGLLLLATALAGFRDLAGPTAGEGR